MSYRNWFSLALRILGVMQLIEAADMLLQAYDIHAGVFTPQIATVQGSLNYAIVHGAIGIILLFGAVFLAGLIVGREHRVRS